MLFCLIEKAGATLGSWSAQERLCALTGVPRRLPAWVCYLQGELQSMIKDSKDMGISDWPFRILRTERDKRRACVLFYGR